VLRSFFTMLSPLAATFLATQLKLTNTPCVRDRSRRVPTPLVPLPFSDSREAYWYSGHTPTDMYEHLSLNTRDCEPTALYDMEHCNTHSEQFRSCVTIDGVPFSHELQSRAIATRSTHIYDRLLFLQETFSPEDVWTLEYDDYQNFVARLWDIGIPEHLFSVEPEYRAAYTGTNYSSFVNAYSSEEGYPNGWAVTTVYVDGLKHVVMVLLPFLFYEFMYSPRRRFMSFHEYYTTNVKMVLKQFTVKLRDGHKVVLYPSWMRPQAVEFKSAHPRYVKLHCNCANEHMLERLDEFCTHIYDQETQDWRNNGEYVLKYHLELAPLGKRIQQAIPLYDQQKLVVDLTRKLYHTRSVGDYATYQSVYNIQDLDEYLALWICHHVGDALRTQTAPQDTDSERLREYFDTAHFSDSMRASLGEGNIYDAVRKRIAYTDRFLHINLCERDVFFSPFQIMQEMMLYVPTRTLFERIFDLIASKALVKYARVLCDIGITMELDPSLASSYDLRPHMFVIPQSNRVCENMYRTPDTEMMQKRVLDSRKFGVGDARLSDLEFECFAGPCGRVCLCDN